MGTQLVDRPVSSPLTARLNSLCEHPLSTWLYGKPAKILADYRSGGIGKLRARGYTPGSLSRRLDFIESLLTRIHARLMETLEAFADVVADPHYPLLSQERRDDLMSYADVEPKTQDDLNYLWFSLLRRTKQDLQLRSQWLERQRLQVVGHKLYGQFRGTTQPDCHYVLGQPLDTGDNALKMVELIDDFWDWVRDTAAVRRLGIDVTPARKPRSKKSRRRRVPKEVSSEEAAEAPKKGKGKNKKQR